jgi:acyl carrier protein
MGLDSVELIIALEKTFKITFSEKDAEQLRTPKAVIAFIASKVKLGAQTLCLTRSAFYFVRRILVDEYGIERKQCRPSSDFTGLIPKKYHKELWNTIKRRAKTLDWPALSRPSWVSSVIAGSTIIGSTLLVIKYSMLTGIAGFIGILAVGLFMTRPFRSEIPSCYRKLNQLVECLVTCDSKYFRKQAGWNYEQIRLTVKKSVMEQIGVDEYDEEWDFVKDFGIDR